MNLRLTLPIVFAFAFPHLIMPAQAQVVPGTGQQIIEVFDDFEDPTWAFTLNLPKASSNMDKTERHPSGFSNNRLYLESLYRGTPDFVQRVETPPGGIPGSTGALAMQTLNSGIPGRHTYEFQQDDLIAGVQQKLGYMLPVSWTPSYTCRVYIPPFDKWEHRHGSHFGFRADCTTTIEKPSSVGKFFKNVKMSKKLEQYWPGFFIQLSLKEKSGQKEDFAQLVIRGDQLGHEVPGPKITRPGWWTLGLSFTPDGRVHYYAHEGVANLTARDHLYSGLPYGYRCEQTSTFFFNIVNQDDGRSWSTRWIVDDPKVFVATGSYRPPVQQQVVKQPATPAAAPQTATAAPVQPMPVTPPVVAAQPAPATPNTTVATPSVPANSTPAAVPKVVSKPDDIPLLPPPYKAPAAPTAPVVKPQTPSPATPAVTPTVTPPVNPPLVPPVVPTPVPETEPGEGSLPVPMPQEAEEPKEDSPSVPTTASEEEQPSLESPQPAEGSPAEKAPETPALPELPSPAPLPTTPE